jgi:hypothetical protein
VPQNINHSVPPWEAYADLFQMAQDANGGTRDLLVDALNQDAEKRVLPRCKYSKRDIDYWKAPPKGDQPTRLPRYYRAAHLHQFFTDLLNKSGKTSAYARHLDAIGPRPANVQAEEHKIMGQAKRKDDIIIDLASFSTKLNPLRLRLSALRDVSDLTNKAFLALDAFVKPYHYGHTWVLRNKATGKVLKNRRIIDDVGPGKPVADPRPLSAVNVTGGTELEAIPLV